MSSVTEFGEASTFTRGEIVSIDDSARGQTMTVRGYRGETFTKVLRDQPHGFSSVPPIGATGWFERIGSSDRLRAIGFDSDKRPVASPDGSAVLYDSSGNVIFAKGADGVKMRAKAGGIEVEAETGNITLKRGGMTATLSDQRVEFALASGLKVVMTPTRVDLGGEGGARVATDSGLSSKVFAVL
jgi:phage gp45-like